MEAAKIERFLISLCLCAFVFPFLNQIKVDLIWVNAFEVQYFICKSN
jgi:hypothetical protein